VGKKIFDDFGRFDAGFDQLSGASPAHRDALLIGVKETAAATPWVAKPTTP